MTKTTGKDAAREKESSSAGKSGGILTRALLLVALSNSAFFLVHNSSYPVFPLFVKGRGGSETDIAFIVGSIGLVSTLSRPLSGWAIDVWGRRQMMIVGSLMMAFSMAFTGFGVTIAAIAAFRIVQGLAVGVFNTASQTYVSDVAPLNRRAETLGYVNTFQTLASSMSPTIAFALLTWLPARGLNEAASWWPGLNEGLLSEYSFAAFFIVTLIVALAGTAVLVGIPDTRSSEVSRGFRWSHVAEPRAVVPMLLTVLSIVPFGGLLAFMSFFAPERGLENVGLFFTVQSLGIFLSGLTMGRVADRYGRYPVVVIGMFLSGIAMLLIALAPNAAVLLAASFFSGFVQGGSRNAMAALTADRVRPERRGAALSTYAMGFDIGVGLGSPILGYIAATRDVSSAFVFSAIVVLVGSVLAAVFLRTGSERARA